MTRPNVTSQEVTFDTGTQKGSLDAQRHCTTFVTQGYSKVRYLPKCSPRWIAKIFVGVTMLILELDSFPESKFAEFAP
jgi:hypothetical protein